MGYSGDQTALTECQWETMMNHLWTNPPAYIDWCSDVQSDLNITTNTTWDGPKIMNRNVIVKNGATLTVECCELRMGEGMYIRVEKGGRLVVDGATITNHCDARWAGIEVEGDPTLSQTTANQGSLRILNESVVENATTAIFTGTNGWGSQGGAIIEVDNSTFLNNRRSAAFMQYTLSDNISYFDSCTFELNANYWDTDYIDMVTIWDVRGIEFTNCTFLNDNTVITSREHGVYTIDAGFNVTNNCSFDGFEGGIYSTNSNTTNTFTVDGATFDNNAVGIYAGSVDDIEITNNTYTVGNYNTSTFDHGLFLITSTGFHVENNTFDRQGSSSTPIGIECHNTGDDYNNIYRNTFDGLQFGNHAYGDNREKTIAKSTGLEYLCNDNSNNTYDFMIAVDNSQASYYSGIKYQQGAFAESAGNTFSLNTTPTGSDLDNLSDHLVRYYYDTGTDREPSNTVNVTNILNGNANTCSSQINAMVAQLRSNDLEKEMHSYRNTYLKLKKEYESLLDNGNTEELISSLKSTTIMESNQLLGQLHRTSPWLSSDIFISILELEEPIFSNEALVELLIKNPDVLTDHKLLLLLKSSLDPKELELLLALSKEQSTERTQLEDRTSYYFNKMHVLINQLIRNQHQNTTIQLGKIREWLAYKESLNSEYAIIETWLQEAKPEEALNYLNSIPDHNILNEKQQLELEQYVLLTKLKVKALNSDRTIADFNDAEVKELTEIAQSKTGRASIQAKGILDFFYDYSLSPNESTMDHLGTTKNNFQLKIPETAPLATTPTPTITVSPNPTNGELVFDLSQITYSYNEVASIAILDQNGKLVKSIIVPNGQKRLSWDTKELRPGFYFFKVTSSASVLGNGRFLIVR